MAGIYRHGQTLMSELVAANTVFTGTTYRIQPSDSDRQEDSDATWKAFCVLTQSGGATSPTSDIDIQTSADGTNWVTAASMTGLSADGTQTEILSLATLMPYIRAKTALGGGTAPNHTAKVTLMSDAPFALVAV